MKNLLIVMMLCTGLLLSAAEPVNAAPAKSSANTAYDRVLLLDDFDDSDLKTAPEWWLFDNLRPGAQRADDASQGQAYLKLTGQTKNYYVGGLGFYFGKDASQYDALVLDIKGSGAQIGILRIQLFDDDNNTYQLEQDKEFKPVYDDHLEYELTVDWTGWRTIEIPLSRFADVNPGVGDDRLNLSAANGSGGLLHLQIIVAVGQAAGSVDIGLDNLKLVRNKSN